VCLALESHPDGHALYLDNAATVLWHWVRRTTPLGDSLVRPLGSYLCQWLRMSLPHLGSSPQK
jgi:hypothetical protein